MVFQQAYFTSCEVGLRGTKGFQMHAASPNLDPGTLSLLERVGSYAPPRSCPSRPTEEDLAAFPESLTFSVLPDGTAMLARTRYVGKDYSGRYGNFFTHYVVASDTYSLLEPVTHIQTWKAPFWRADHPDGGTELAPLKKLEPGHHFSEGSFSRFLEAPARAAKVRDFLASVLAALENDRPIILVDQTDDDVARWIALAIGTLPRNLLSRVTFTTYTKSPYDTDVMICGTTSDSDFAFSESELKHQFYVFDFVEQRFSPAPEAHAFAKVMSFWYVDKQESEVQKFCAFANQFGVAIQASKIDALMQLYSMTELGLTAPDQKVKANTIASGARFAIDYGLQRDEKVLNAITIALQEFRDEDPDTFNLIARDLYIRTHNSKNQSHATRVDVDSFYVDWALWVLSEATCKGIDDLNQTFQTYPVAPDFWMPRVSRLVQLIEHLVSEEAPDLERLNAMLTLVEELGVMPEVRTAFGHVADSLLSGSLDDIDALAFIDRLVNVGAVSDDEPRLIQRLGKLLHTRNGRAKVHSMLTEYPHICQHVRRVADEPTDADVLVVAESVDIARAPNRARALVATWDRLQHMTSLTVEQDHFDALIELVYAVSGDVAEHTLSVEEAQTLEKVGPSITSSFYVERTLHSILGAPDVLNGSSRPAKLLKRLIEKQGHIMPSARTDVEAAQILIAWRDAFNPDVCFADQLKTTMNILDQLAAANTEAQRKLLEVALPKLLFTKPAENIYAALATLHEKHPRAVARGLETEIPRRYSGKKRDYDSWSHLFHFLHSNKNNTYIKKIYETTLPEAFKSFKKDDQKELNTYMEDGDYGKNWKAWRKSFSLSRKLMRGVRNMFDL